MSEVKCLKTDIRIMQFDHIDHSHKYIHDILYVIRQGLKQRSHVLERKRREGINTESLVDAFNVIGLTDVECKVKIGVQKEHERRDGKGKEDIYFYLNDDEYTRIFYAEAKRLPMSRYKNKEEYVTGQSSTDNPSGGIQRYKLRLHGDGNLKSNGMFAYVENKSIEEWLQIINSKILNEYPDDSPLILTDSVNEYISTHAYEEHKEYFTMYHFWIDLTKN